jgi:hypothetical protein
MHFHLTLKRFSHLGSLLWLSGAAVTERSRTTFPLLALLYDKKVLPSDFSKDVVGKEKTV